jgi:Tfp pilus assembly protein PilE
MLRIRAARRGRASSRAGLTLVEVAILVSLIGVFLAVFVPTFAREVRRSKLAEASEQLLVLERRAASYFEAAHEVSVTAPASPPPDASQSPGTTRLHDLRSGALRSRDAISSNGRPRVRRYCLPELAPPAPVEVSEDAQRVDFAAEETPGHATWAALSFQPGETRFRYSFIPEQSGCGLEPSGGAPALTVRAEGDLDGDGRLSRFERRSSIGADHVLVPARELIVEDRVE